MENLKNVLLFFQFFVPFWPFIVVPLILGIIGLFIRVGFEETIQILKRTIIGIAIATVIYVIVLLFI